MTRMRTDAVRKQSEAQTVPLDRIWSQIIVLGITGGVGAGKSTILTALHEQYGALVIECDEVGRALQQKGTACYEPMRQLFGDGILFPDGTIDRKAVARVIYTLVGLAAIWCISLLFRGRDEIDGGTEDA